MNKKKITEAKDIHVSGDFIAGDQYNYYYTGDFASLAEYYISPEPVFQRVRTDDFIGRDWLTAKVDAFLNDPNRRSGAFLLIGDAGVGKTSFMAHLVKERRYLHLFAEQAPGQAMLQRAMQSLGSQLVTRYQIGPYKDRDTLNALSVFPDFLERILRLAARTLTEGEKIVIVCDALDEAGTFPDHFVFGLPKELPDGVYFILSQRPVNVKLPNFVPVIERLEAQGEGNLYDMQAYLSAVAKRPEVAGQIRAKEYSEEFFIQTLKEKSQGVWMYLHYIIKEIESGARAPLDLANLPTGLVGYYAEYWDAWRTGKRGKGEEAWDELYAPLLTTLAAAQEAIPVDWLIQWADVTAKPREVTRLLTEHWRAFITEKDVNGQKAYTPYHLSFKDFITGRVDTAKLPPAQANLVKDLAAQTVDAHKRIVSVFEKECNGEWEKLVEQNYPRLHLTAHLNEARDYEKLRIMLTEGDENIKWAEAKEKKEETYEGFLFDLEFIWAYAKQERNYNLLTRCMLIESSIHTIASNIPEQLLAELSKAGIWSYSRCISTIRQFHDPEKKLRSIKLLAPNIPAVYFLEVLSLVDELEDNISKVQALSALIPYLTENEKLKAIQFALKIANKSQDVNQQVRALSLIIPLAQEESKTKMISEALDTIHAIKSKAVQINALSTLLPYLQHEQKMQIIQNALLTIPELTSLSDQSNSLIVLGPHLTDIHKQSILEIAKAHKTQFRVNVRFEYTRILCAIAILLDEDEKSQTLTYLRDECDWIDKESWVALVPHLPDELKKEAVAIACEIKSEIKRSIVLSSIAPFLNEELRIKILEAAHKIKRKSAFAKILIGLVPYQPKEIQMQALKAAYEISTKEDRVVLLSSLIPYFDGSIKHDIIKEVLTASRLIEDQYFQGQALSVLAPYLSVENIARLTAIAFEFKDDYARTYTLLDVIPYMKEEQQLQVLEAARASNDLAHRIILFAKLLPYLNEEIRLAALQVEVELVNNIQNEHLRWNCTSLLLPYLDHESITQLYKTVLLIKKDEDRIRVLATFIPYLTAELRYDLMEAICNAMEDYHDINYYDILLLPSLLPYLVDDVQKMAIERGLNIADKIESDFFFIELITVIIPYLKGKQKTRSVWKALATIHALGDENDKLRAELYDANDDSCVTYLFNLVPHLENDEMKKSAIAIAKQVKNPGARLKALSAMAPHISKELKMEILRLALKYEDQPQDPYQSIRAEILLSLAPYLDKNLEVDLINELLQSGRRQDDVINLWKKMEFYKWEEVLIPLIKFKSEKRREDSLIAFQFFPEILAPLFSENFVTESFRSVNDVTRWWP